MEDKAKAIEFMKKRGLGVIATVTAKGTPEAGVIQTAVADDGCIVFDTFTTYRKYANLKRNPHVAFVFGGDERITVQYEGVAEEMPVDGDDQYLALYLKAQPGAAKWRKFKELTYFKVVPHWLRYLDALNEPHLKFEVNFP